MAELLLVRSGDSEDPVTRRLQIGADEFEQSVGSYELHYLGTELPPIGETSRIAEFTTPDHVVLTVGRREVDKFGLDEQGFYLIEDLSPFAFMEN